MKVKEYTLYIFIFPNNKRYIGITNNFKRRMNNYKSGKENSRVVGKAIKKYGIQSIKVEILHMNTWDECCKKEIELIALYKTNIVRYGKGFGYNETDGGDGGNGYFGEKHWRWKGDLVHGTFRGYRQFNCRCKLCVEAFREKNREYGKKRNKELVHGTTTGFQKGCRCDLCIKTREEYVEEQRNKRMPKHGTLNEASKHGCRCELCYEILKKYNRERERKRRAERRENNSPQKKVGLKGNKNGNWKGGQKHGTASSYTYGCRCDLCKEAKRLSRKIK